MNPKFIIIAAAVLCVFLFYNQKLIYSQIEKIEKYMTRKVIPLVEQNARQSQSQIQPECRHPAEPIGRYSASGHYISPEQAAINEKVLASRNNPTAVMCKQPRESPPEIPTATSQQASVPVHETRRPPPIQVPASDPYEDLFGEDNVSTL